MRRLTLDDLASAAESFDESVVAMEGIDHFCTSTDWVLPAAEALMPARESWVHCQDSSYWAFMRGRHPDGFYYLEPLEAMWALACPLVGREVDLLIEGLVALCEQPKEAWTLMALPGLPAGHPLFVAIVAKLASRVKLGLGLSTVRLLSRIEGGIDGFLGRRTRNFRRSLRRSETRAREAGITFEEGRGSATELFERIMAVEHKGWKGRDGVGITQGCMHDFYRLMLPRLCRRGAERVVFARQEDQDVAYILGGMRLGTYRGLQFSYDADCAALGLGNLLQLEQMRLLHCEGAQLYDLGTHMDYKLRWADQEQETLTLLLMRE